MSMTIKTVKVFSYRYAKYLALAKQRKEDFGVLEGSARSPIELALLFILLRKKYPPDPKKERCCYICTLTDARATMTAGAAMLYLSITWAVRTTLTLLGYLWKSDSEKPAAV